MAIRRGGSRSNSRQITIEILGDDRQARRAFEAAVKASEDFSTKTQRSLDQVNTKAQRFAQGFAKGFDTARFSLDTFARRLGENVRGDLDALVTWGQRAVLAVTGVATAVGAIAIKGGLDRALNIEDARAKLSALGHDAEGVEAAMTSALDAVKGTSFGLDAAAGAAAQAMAAGVEAGEDLTRVLRLTGDAAAFMGNDFERAGQIINKVLASDRLTMREVNQLHVANIGILQMLADQYGVSALEMREMVEDGKVNSEIFLQVLEDNIGGAALKLGETTRGTFSNMRAAMSRFGEALVTNILPVAKDFFVAVTEGFDRLTRRIKPFVEEFTQSDLFRTLRRNIERLPELFDRAVDAAIRFWEATDGLRTAIGNVVAGGAAIIGFVIDLNNRLGGLPAILAAVAIGLNALFAHPVIAGLGLVAWAVGEITREGREAEAAVGRLKSAIEEFETTGDDTRLFEEVGDQLADIVGDAQLLVDLLRELAITPEQAVGFVLGDPDDIEAVNQKLREYQTEAERAFQAGDISAHEFARRVGATGSVLSLTEEALTTVQARYKEGEDAVNAFLEAQRNLDREAADRALRQYFKDAEQQGDAWRDSAAAAEEYRNRIEALEGAIYDLAQTWGNELNREFQNWINIFEQAPELELTKILGEPIERDGEKVENVLASGLDAMIQNAETRIDQAERWLEGLQVLQEAGLTNLLEEFRARGVEGLADLEDVVADLDTGGARALELEEMLSEARELGTSVTGELGLAMAAEALTLYAQAEEIGEGVVEAIARGVRGANIEIDLSLVTSARIQAISRDRPILGRPGTSSADFIPRALGGRVDPGGTYLVGDGGRTEVLQLGPAHRGFIWPSIPAFAQSMAAATASSTTINLKVLVDARGATDPHAVGLASRRAIARELETFQRGMPQRRL